MVGGRGRLVGGCKMHIIRIDLITDLLWVKIEAEKRNCWGKLKIFVSSDLSGIKIDFEKGDIGNFKVFVLGVGCEWFGVGGWLVGGGKMHIIRIDLITDLFWVKIDAKK